MSIVFEISPYYSIRAAKEIRLRTQMFTMSNVRRLSYLGMVGTSINTARLVNLADVTTIGIRVVFTCCPLTMSGLRPD